MARVEAAQVIEFIKKSHRDQVKVLEQILSGEIDREALQQMITQSKRDPKERLARSLLRKAQTPVVAQLQYGDPSSGAFAQIAAVYELLGEGDMADKITYRSGSAYQVYLERIKALCEKNDLERARKLVERIPGGYSEKCYAWIAIADKSQLESDYAYLDSVINFHMRLAVAVSRAKKDGGGMLQKMRDETQKRMDHEYWDVLTAMAKEDARRKYFSLSRSMIQKLHCQQERQFEATFTLMNESKDPQDIASYRDMIIQVYGAPTGEYTSGRYLICLGHIAAITGDEKDFVACRQILQQQSLNSSAMNDGYSTLALAYAKHGDIPAARDIANKIVIPHIESETLARMARIVLSPDWNPIATV